MTAPISVDPTALAASGTTVSGEGDAAAGAIGSLESALSGAGAMFGHDAAGMVFAQGYTASGKALLDAASSAVNALRRVGFGVQTSAANYGHANASSTIGGGTSPVPVPTAPRPFSAPGMPPPLGSGIAAPLGWALVEAFVGDFWPDGNPGELHAAAGAWRAFGTAMSGLAGQVGAAGPGVSAQQIPEAGQIVSALGQIGTGLGDIASQAQAMASAVDGFANTVDATQNAVRGLLHQLGPMGLLDTIGGILTGDDPMAKIREIAHEINIVLHNMKREADATSQAFSQGINALDSVTNSFESWAKREFTDVLGQPVGGALSMGLNAFVDLPEGAVKFVAETVQGIGQLDPTRFVTDPSGAAKTWEGMAEGLAVVTNPVLLASEIMTDPGGSLDTVKGLVDWKDVDAGHPFRAVGYDTAQVASAIIPGVGEAEPAIEGAEVAGRAASVEERAAAGAARDGVPGLAGASSASDSITTQAGRASNDLNAVKVPESAPPAAAPGAGPGASAPSGRAPVETPPPVEPPSGRAPVETAPPVDAPRAESPGPSAPEPHASEPPSPAASDSSPPSSSNVAESTLAHDGASPPPPGPEPLHIAENDPARPPPGGGSYDSVPAASEPSRPVAEPGPGGGSADVSHASGAVDKVPVSVGANGGESTGVARDLSPEATGEHAPASADGGSHGVGSGPDNEPAHHAPMSSEGSNSHGGQDPHGGHDPHDRHGGPASLTIHRVISRPRTFRR